MERGGSHFGCFLNGRGAGGQLLVFGTLKPVAPPPLPWADENVCDCVGVVNKHLHSPSGRVGPSGPERGIRFAKNYAINHKTAPPGRYRVRPPRETRGEVNWRVTTIFVSPVLGWADANGFNCVVLVGNQHHSPSGRVGLSGPEGKP